MQVKNMLAALTALALTAATAIGQSSNFGPSLPVTNITVNGDSTISLKWDDYSDIVGFQLLTTLSLEAPDWKPMTDIQTGLTRMGTNETVFALTNTVVTVPGDSPTSKQFYRLVSIKGKHKCAEIITVGEGEEKVYYIQVDRDPDVYIEVDGEGNAKKPLTYWKDINGGSRTQVWDDSNGGWTTTEPDTGCTCGFCDCDNPEGCQCFIVGGDSDEYLFQRVGKEKTPDGKQVRVRLTNPGQELTDYPPTYWVWDDEADGGNGKWRQVWRDKNGDWNYTGTWDVGDGKLGEYDAGTSVGNDIDVSNPGPEPSDGVTWTYELESGDLPPGLTLNSDGTITGTPTTPGDYTFTVKATPDNGGDPVVEEFTIKVNAPPPFGPAPGATTFSDGTVDWVVLKDNRPPSGQNIPNHYGVNQPSDGDGTVLIMTEKIYVLGTPYHSAGSYVRLGTSDRLRPALNAWWNNNNNISSDLRAKVRAPVNVNSDVRNTGTWLVSADMHTENEAAGRTTPGTASAVATSLFVLSVSEVNQYFGAIPNSDTIGRVIRIANGATTSDPRHWWLRSPGTESQYCVAYVNYNGGMAGVTSSQVANGTSNFGFRPALWIKP